MRILLTNDDGYHAPGMAVLEAIARQLSDDIWVCAPSEEQSGAGHSLTLSRPVRIRQHGERRWSCTGTPTDSVMMAVGKLMPEKPDLILSGVNRGANLGDDITYSGTVSAAIEGALAGIRSIALSQVYAREGICRERVENQSAQRHPSGEDDAVEGEPREGQLGDNAAEIVERPLAGEERRRVRVDLCGRLERGEHDDRHQRAEVDQVPSG